MRPIDIAWLVAFRVVFGGLLAVSMERFIAYGWIDELLLQPQFRFKYWGFSWVEPLGAQAMHLLFPVLVGLGLAVAAGFFFRITAPLFALGLTYVQLLDVSIYLNHYYLAALLCWLLALSPAGRSGSVDAWMARRFLRRPRAHHPVRIAAVWLVLFRAQIGLVYFFAGMAKLQGDWLLHAQPLRIWLGASTELPWIGAFFTWEHVPLLLSWCGFLFDSTIVFWLSWSKSRPYAYVVVIFFHVFTRLLFDIGMFPWIMSAAALVFFSPAWPRRLAAWLGERMRFRSSRIERGGESAALRTNAMRASGTPCTPVWSKLGIGFAALYLVVQIALPLRHWAYGGDVLWDEQGMRFSWRVMVRAKGGAIEFVVRSREGKTWHVSPSHYLTSFQENEMSGQPDLILQLAHHIAREWEARGEGPVEVRADTRVSLNGRRAVPLLDPAVDLTRVRDGLGRASWIAPPPTQPPPRIRPVL